MLQQQMLQIAILTKRYKYNIIREIYNQYKHTKMETVKSGKRFEYFKG